MQNRRSFHEEFDKESEELFSTDRDCCYLFHDGNCKTEEACDGSGNRTGSRVKKVGFLSRIWRTLGMSFVWETPKAKMISDYLVRDKGADKKKEPVSDRERKKDMRKNKIIYWDEPRIQNRISKSIYFNTG